MPLSLPFLSLPCLLLFLSENEPIIQLLNNNCHISWEYETYLWLCPRVGGSEELLTKTQIAIYVEFHFREGASWLAFVISEVVPAAWGTGAGSPRGDVGKQQVVPAGAPAAASAGTNLGLPPGSSTPIPRCKCYRWANGSWWAELVLRSLGWRASSHLQQADAGLGMASSASSAKQLGIMSSLLCSETYPKHWQPKGDFDVLLVNYKLRTSHKWSVE